MVFPIAKGLRPVHSAKGLCLDATAAAVTADHVCTAELAVLIEPEASDNKAKAGIPVHQTLVIRGDKVNTAAVRKITQHALQEPTADLGLAEELMNRNELQLVALAHQAESDNAALATGHVASVCAPVLPGQYKVLQHIMLERVQEELLAHCVIRPAQSAVLDRTRKRHLVRREGGKKGCLG